MEDVTYHGPEAAAAENYRKTTRIGNREEMERWANGLFKEGSELRVRFLLTPEDMESFIALSGDTNAIHVDEDEAAACPIGRISTPGLLGAMVFSRVLGTLFPGHGTVYRSQSLQFRRPMTVNRDYVASFLVQRIVPTKNLARIRTSISEEDTGSVCTTGVAVVINRKMIAKPETT